MLSQGGTGLSTQQTTLASYVENPQGGPRVFFGINVKSKAKTKVKDLKAVLELFFGG